MQEKQATPSQGRSIQSSDTGEKARFLARHKLFQTLNGSALQDVERVTTLAIYTPGRILYRPGEASTAMFLLCSGEVQIYHLSTDGRKLITETLVAGASFGEFPTLGKGTHSSFAEVTANTSLYIINKHDVEQLLLQYPIITRALLDIMSQRCLQLETQLINTAFKSVTARLAALLLQLADSSNRIEGMSHEVLAEHLGVYRETVSVALRELREAGAIELGRKHVSIHDKALLETFTT